MDGNDLSIRAVALQIAFTMRHSKASRRAPKDPNRMS